MGGDKTTQSPLRRSFCNAGQAPERVASGGEEEGEGGGGDQTGKNQRDGGEWTEDSREKAPTKASNWDRVVDLVLTAFGEGKLVEDSMWQAVVLIPKGENDYCGIGLVAVMCKVVTAILNFRLTASITFHDFLHGFWAGRSTSIATLDSKVLLQLAALRYLHRVYDSLERSKCLEILEGYKIVP